MLYDDYLRSLNDRAVEAFSKIDIGTNLDYGPEAEGAVHTWLRQTLPAKYGVCKGYIVNETGDRAGDDLILFDPVNFPSLRADGPPRFDRKEKIPVQAAYGYLEIKNVLSLEAGDEASSGQSLAKAVQQVAKAKRLIDGRAAPRRSGWPRVGYPDRDDWAFGAIICNGVRSKKGQPLVEDPNAIAAQISEALERIELPVKDMPNLIIAGAKCVFHPIAVLPDSTGGKAVHPVPFTTNECRFASVVFEGQDVQIGFGFGLAFMLHALGGIALPAFRWDVLLHGMASRSSASPPPT
jgi:hypothetical protein